MVKELEIAIKELENLPEEIQKEIVNSWIENLRKVSDSSETNNLRYWNSVVKWEFWNNPSEDIYQDYLR